MGTYEFEDMEFVMNDDEEFYDDDPLEDYDSWCTSRWC